MNNTRYNWLDAEQIDREILQNPAGKVETDERAYTAQLKNLVEHVHRDDQKCKLIMLSGPSSSGKTTTARLLKRYFKEKGVQTDYISLDNFYLSADQAPLLPDGQRDFESVYALDLDLLHACLQDLIEKRACVIPHFDFQTRSRAPEGITISLPPGSVAVVEGIHAMNPEVEKSLPPENLFKVYVSVETGLAFREKEILDPRDIRLIRRIIRDYTFRNSSPQNTLDMWKGVVDGEKKYLYPYKDNADFKINSLHSYEPCIFKKELLELLKQVDENDPYYSLADALRSEMDPFIELDHKWIPADSMMREFIGEGKFD